MKLIGGDWLIAMDTPQKDELDSALLVALTLLEYEVETGENEADVEAAAESARVLWPLHDMLSNPND